MSYSNETVHYGIPLPQQTDLVNGLDWNTSSEKVDGALYDATQIANTLKSDMEEVKEDIVGLKAEDTKIEQNATELTARVSTLEQNMQSDEEDIQDAFDMITDKEVTQAQSDVHVDEKEWFRYNGVLYVATKEINIGDTIVPNENCRATNIEDEMPSGGTESYAEQMICDTEVVGDTFTSDMSKGQYFRHNNDLCLVNVDVTEGTALEENVNYSVVDMASGVVGNLANLNWSASPSTVSSALESLGDVSTLSTESKTNIVSAINELNNNLIHSIKKVSSGTYGTLLDSLWDTVKDLSNDTLYKSFLVIHTTDNYYLRLPNVGVFIRDGVFFPMYSQTRGDGGGLHTLTVSIESTSFAYSLSTASLTDYRNVNITSIELFA